MHKFSGEPKAKRWPCNLLIYHNPSVRLTKWNYTDSGTRAKTDMSKCISIFLLSNFRNVKVSKLPWRIGCFHFSLFCCRPLLPVIAWSGMEYMFWWLEYRIAKLRFSSPDRGTSFSSISIVNPKFILCASFQAVAKHLKHLLHNLYCYCHLSGAESLGNGLSLLGY